VGSSQIHKLFTVKDAYTKGHHHESKVPLHVAGVRVTHGELERKFKFRVLRNGVVIKDNLKLHSMKNLQDDVREADKGKECGLSFDQPCDFQVGDIVECYRDHRI
jgi:translation initiation factor IF-2